MQPRVLLYVAQLLEPSIAVAAFVWLLARVHPDVLHELVIAGERLEALLALVWLDLVAGHHAAGSDPESTPEAAEATGHAGHASRTPVRTESTRHAQVPACVHLHPLVHEYLRKELPGLVGMLLLFLELALWPIAYRHFFLILQHRY